MTTDGDDLIHDDSSPLVSTIVVPLDGSPHSLAALRPAAAFAAGKASTDVLLVSCVDGDQDRDQVRDFLEEQADRFRGVVGVDTAVTCGSTATDGILETLSSRPDSTLCLASRGRGGLRTAVLGSVAADVVGRADHPMIVVGPACQSVLLPGEQGDMVVCSDGSAFAAGIVPVAARWAKDLELTPRLVEVVGPDEDVVHVDEAPRNRNVEAATDRLRQLASGFDGSGQPAEISVLHGHAARSIVASATRPRVAMVSLTTHGRSGIARARLGSVATEVVRRSPCPVLLLRPSD